MCRLLGYLGDSIQLDRVLCDPEHSLVVQSYQPREMTSGLLNADGYGIGWYERAKQSQPFTYKNLLPIWSDINLDSLSRYITSACILAYIRSATSGQAVDLSNCQPFVFQNLSYIHNGFIDNFRQTLYRPIRERLSDDLYHNIQGTTDSEHIFALLLQIAQTHPNWTLHQALKAALLELQNLADTHNTKLSANLILSDGQTLIASRFAANTKAPSLYWLNGDAAFPEAVLIASEPLFPANWQPFPDGSIVCVGENREFDWYVLD
ncbi:MAG: ergothioneine biosynthesis protein EgtC [Cyanobacteria bacterium SID2]|nr:ergothioneine biosynthesis protein EgtC [Cyanobacteria bacterium SID2]MBP0004367.1 ergothioneine biosynthesis protein EgtC [Cyanobacteria bacterium SBC]